MTLLLLRTAVDFPNHLPSCLIILLCGQVLFALLWVRWWLARSSLYTTANGRFPSQSIWTTTIEMRAEWTPFTQGGCCWVGHHRCVIRTRYYHWFILFNFIIISERIGQLLLLFILTGFFWGRVSCLFYFLIPSNNNLPLFTVSLSSKRMKLQQCSFSVSLSPLKCFKR